MFTQDYVSIHIPKWSALLERFKGKPCRMLEVGVFEGRATVWFFENILTNEDSEHTAVDTFRGGVDQLDNGVDCVNILERYRVNTRPFEDRDMVCIGRSVDKLAEIKEWYDIIYVDGSHLAPDVLSDIVLSWRLLNVGGIMLMDDYAWQIDPVVERRPKAAIDAWLAVNKGRYKLLDNDMQVVMEKIS